MRHTSSLPRRAAALLLALLLSLPTAYAAAGEQKLQTTARLADGLTYRNTVTVNGGSRVESFALELDADSGVQPILLQADGTLYGGGSVNYAVAQAQARGYHVLGAINTDFFSMSTGVPTGLVVEDGVYKSSNDGENALVLTDGRAAVLDRPQVSLSLCNRRTGLTVIPNHFNKARAESGGVYLLNGHFSTVSTRCSGAGWYVCMRAAADPDTERVPDLTVNSDLVLEVTGLIRSDRAISINPDEYILTAADAGGWGEIFASFQPGDQITLTTRCQDPALSDAQWACGVGDIMVREGAITDSSAWVYRSDGLQPRSALGIKPDGSMVLYAVDGRQSDYSAGLSQYNLADELLSQGCATVVNLDGGGSTSFSAWVPGQTGPAMLNKPSDGRARGCASYLMLVTDQRGDGQAASLASADNGQVVLTGSSLQLARPAAIDEGLNPVEISLPAVSYSPQNGLGALRDGVYTAGLIRGDEDVLMTAGSLSGQFRLHVVDQLTDLRIGQAGGASSLASLSVKEEEQVQFTVSGSYWGRAALRDFGPVSVSVQGDVGTVDRDGLFTAAREPAEGSITFSAGGLSRTVRISPIFVHDDVLPDRWSYDAVEYCYTKGIVRGVSPTRFGPENPMRRGDFILMLYNAAGKPEAAQPCTFADVSPDDYYYAALSWAQSQGLATGTGDGRFSPGDYITREQAFALLYRFLPLVGKSCPDAPLSFLDRFRDRDTLAGYAGTPTATLTAQGLVTGSSGSLDPRSILTREQMAALVCRVMEHTPITDIIPDTPDTPDTPDVPSEGHKLALSQSQVTLASGGSVTLTAVILPSVDGAAVTWTSSDPGAAAVTAGGMVTNLYPGTEAKTVTVTAAWNGLSSSCAVTCQSAAKTGTVTNAERGLNIRSGPGTTFDRVGILKNGERVVVLGQENGWYHILFLNSSGQAAIGYVSGDYMTLNQ